MLGSDFLQGAAKASAWDKGSSGKGEIGKDQIDSKWDEPEN